VPKQGRHSNQSNPAQDVPNRVPNEDPRNDVTKSVRNSELLLICETMVLFLLWEMKTLGISVN